jgi:predicted alpha/beta-fold hydrolase
LLQTIFYEILRKLAKKDCGIIYEREFVELQDGGQLSLDWPVLPKEFKVTDSTPILAILSGMTGGRKDIYVATLIHDSFKRNCRPVLLNQRGLSNTPITTPKLYCGETTEDVHTALLAIKGKYPKNSLYAVGLSLGANIITNVRYINEDSILEGRNQNHW